MRTYSSDNQYQSKAGYTGALILFLLAFANFFLSSELFSSRVTLEHQLVFIVSCTILGMLIHELIQQYFFHRANLQNNPHTIKPTYFRSTKNLLLSSFFRFIIYLGLITIPWFIVNNHYYFQEPSFNSTRLFYLYLVILYLILGLPYIYFTLKFKGALRYEFNDYAILSMICLRAIINCLLSIIVGHKKSTGFILTNRRIKKVFLVFLVNFFFLTLMTKFLMLEYNGFSQALNQIMANNFDSRTFFSQYHTVYLMLFHLIFVIDVGLAIIGYGIASRWLNNRTKSVDMSLYGWLVVLLCYPPMNSGFTDQFIGYGRVSTENIITSETGLMIIMPLILICFFVYVWATAALGFKFSNLTNRGIVNIGPYRYFRHPAYTCKNLAWWIDNTYVLSNIWASLALLTWNIIYILRGLTEEKHLQQDKIYQDYQRQVPYRFFPGWKGNKLKIKN